MCLSIVKACLVAFAMLSSVLYAPDVKNPEQDFSVLFKDLRPVERK